MKYRTQPGDMLDAICHRRYAGRKNAVEHALSHNPGLSKHGPVLPAGLEIDLPDMDAAPVKQSIKLWG
ncbi:tail protein X [Pontibacterium sp.]|uniref:tail protein X n=1 Tax=Pontibacterium sp. TaxID=2036026 RepID=UPI0035649EC8